MLREGLDLEMPGDNPLNAWGYGGKSNSATPNSGGGGGGGGFWAGCGESPSSGGQDCKVFINILLQSTEVELEEVGVQEIAEIPLCSRARSVEMVMLFLMVILFSAENHSLFVMQVP